MKTSIRQLSQLMIFASSLMLVMPSSGHHSYSMFAMDEDVLYQGTVVQYRWAAPHAHIVVHVEEGEGIDPRTVGTWDIEGASPAIMTRQGWNRASFQEGDPITLIARPMSDGSKGAALFYAIKEDGSCIYMDVARPEDNSLCESE